MTEGSLPTGPSWWPQDLAERQRVLLHAQPLLEQRLRDGNQPEEARHYDSLALALRVLELVLEASDLDDQVTAARVLDALAPALVAMDRAAGVSPNSERHARTVDRILGTLRNDDEGRQPFQLRYSTFAADGQLVTRLLDFHLLIDAFHPDGSIILKVTTEAANLFLRALAMDLESQQAALEAIVELQLRRGLFDQAVGAARQAQRQSVRYGELLRERLEQTRRDLSRVDWGREMPEVLADMRVHLEVRLEVEDRLLSAADRRLETLELGSEAALQVGRVRGLLEDCRRRHQELHHVLLASRQVFLGEQVRQSFVPRLAVPRPDLGREILEPLLQAPVHRAAEFAVRALALLVPPMVPGVLWLPALIDFQLQPRRPPEAPREADLARDLVDVEEQPAYFPAGVRSEGELLLADIREPIPLSTILAGAAPRGCPVREYVVLRALQAAAHEPPSTDEGRGPGPRDLQARAVGVLDTAEFIGDDLLLAPAAPTKHGISRGERG